MHCPSKQNSWAAHLAAVEHCTCPGCLTCLPGYGGPIMGIGLPGYPGFGYGGPISNGLPGYSGFGYGGPIGNGLSGYPGFVYGGPTGNELPGYPVCGITGLEVYNSDVLLIGIFKCKSTSNK